MDWITALRGAVAELRGSYTVRTPDALQLATALYMGATFFITNDRRLPALPSLGIVVLDDVLASGPNSGNPPTP